MKEYSELRFWYYAIQDGIPGTMYNKTIRYLLRYKKGKWVSRVENKDLQEKIREFYRLSEEKYAEIGNGNIKDGTVRKVKMYEEPLLAVGSAKDPLFEAYKNPEAIGPWHYMPEEWLPGAKSVISLFFPMTEEVKRSNWNGGKEPSEEWLYCRIEGHAFIQNMAGKVKQYLEDQGAKSCVPLLDARFRAYMGTCPGEGMPDVVFGSNWSERHVAYLCGQGTFGLSRGIITRKGIAGRFISILTTEELEVTKREYTELYEYCTRCGACIRRCPVQAISIEHGKEHPPCLSWMLHTKEVYAPRLGCGKCQTKVPCESGIPSTF